MKATDFLRQKQKRGVMIRQYTQLKKVDEINEKLAVAFSGIGLDIKEQDLNCLKIESYYLRDEISLTFSPEQETKQYYDFSFPVKDELFLLLRVTATTKISKAGININTEFTLFANEPST